MEYEQAPRVVPHEPLGLPLSGKRRATGLGAAGHKALGMVPFGAGIICLGDRSVTKCRHLPHVQSMRRTNDSHGHEGFLLERSVCCGQR